MENASPVRLDLRKYNRCVALDHAERERIAGIVLQGDSLHIRLNDPLLRLLEPLKDCLKLTGARESQYSLLREVVAEMHNRQTAFWEWGEAAWIAIYGRCVEILPPPLCSTSWRWQRSSATWIWLI